MFWKLLRVVQVQFGTHRQVSTEYDTIGLQDFQKLIFYYGSKRPAYLLNSLTSSKEFSFEPLLALQKQDKKL